MTRLDEVVARLDRSGDCWLFTGTPNGSGYGRVKVGGRRVMVHRFVYEQVVGPIPDGWQVDHLCGNRLCANPRHLEAVTPLDNLRRSPTVSTLNAAKDRCPQGHPYDHITKRRRRCRRCAAETTRRYIQRRREAAVSP